MSRNEIIAKAIELFKCDTARISDPMGTLFLIIGEKRHTKDNKTSCWRDEHGNAVHFEYLHESCIASGGDEQELCDSMLHYKKLCDLPRENWLEHYVAMEATSGGQP